MDEETGLTGANNLQPGFLQSTILLNLDSEDEGELYVGCSGGRDNAGTWAADFDDAPAGGAGLLVTVKGLKGGHSGLEIHTGRGNALKIMTRVLLGLADARRRAWPGSTAATSATRSRAKPKPSSGCRRRRPARPPTFGRRDERRGQGRTGHAWSRASRSACEAQKGVRKVLKKGLQKKVLLALIALPHGVLKMSADIPGLVETSSNLAIIETGKKEIKIQTSQRSSVASEIEEASQMVRAVFELGGADGHRVGRLPGLEAEPRLADPQARASPPTSRSTARNPR